MRPMALPVNTEEPEVPDPISLTETSCPSNLMMSSRSPNSSGMAVVFAGLSKFRYDYIYRLRGLIGKGTLVTWLRHPLLGE